MLFESLPQQTDNKLITTRVHFKLSPGCGWWGYRSRLIALGSYFDLAGFLLASPNLGPMQVTGLI